MRLDVAAPADPTMLSRSGVVCTVYRSGSPADLIDGTTGLDTFDITSYVTSLDQKSNGASITLSHNGELVGVARPKANQLVQIKLNGYVALNGVINTVGRDHESRGTERRFQVDVKTRDATPWWRDVRRVSPVFGVGADLGGMARSVLNALGLSMSEFTLPNIGIYLAHDNAQLADQSAWDMLEMILQPALLEPWVDANGVLKAVSRNVRRSPDFTLTWPQVLSLDPASNSQRPTTVRVKWLDPKLSKVSQQDQSLAQSSLSAGFFCPRSQADVWWSEDHRQRAELTRLVVKQSVNGGLLHVGNEWYHNTSDFGGTVFVDVDAFLPVLATASLAGLLASSHIPDTVQVGITGTGVTIPVGRTLQQTALNVLLITLMTMGFGVYEIWGTPYDYVHAVNETEAYDQNAADWEERVDEIANDLVPNESVASDLAVSELLYRAKSCDGATLVMADDLRVERGDIIALPDGRQVYVTDFNRPLTRGVDATLSVSGFWL